MRQGIVRFEHCEPALLVSKRQQRGTLRTQSLTAGSITCIQFTSNAHMTVVTIVASWQEKVPEKAAPDPSSQKT